MDEDERFMALALGEAEAALAAGDRPFGAVVVRDGQLVASGRNLETTTLDPTAHGEVVAIRNACKELGTLRLEDCTLFTTCEPCLICSGVIFATKIRRVVIGALWADAPDYFHLDRLSFLKVVDQAGYTIACATGTLRAQCVSLYSHL